MEIKIILIKIQIKYKNYHFQKIFNLLFIESFHTELIKKINTN